jgi:hypothetical protein
MSSPAVRRLIQFRDCCLPNHRWRSCGQAQCYAGYRFRGNIPGSPRQHADAPPSFLFLSAFKGDGDDGFAMGTAAAGAGFLAADEKFIRRHASGQHSPIVADGAPSELWQTVPGGFAAAETHALLKVDGRAPVFRVVKHLKALNWQVIGLLDLSMMVPAARKCRCRHWVPMYRFLELSRYLVSPHFLQTKPSGHFCLNR